MISKRAVEEKWLPPKGTSALPKAVRGKIPKELRYWETSGKEALERRRRIVEEMDVRELAGPELKQVGPWRDYVLQRRTFKGQVVVRTGPSTEVYDLWMEREGKPWHLVVAGDPLAKGKLAAYEDDETGPKLKLAEGGNIDVFDVKKRVEIAPGQPANPTKDTPAFVETADRGQVRTLSEKPEFVKKEFKGGKMKGAWIFTRQEPGASLGEFSRSAGPETKEAEMYTYTCRECEKDFESGEALAEPTCGECGAEGDKAGRRIAGAKVDLIKEIRNLLNTGLDKLKELLGYAEYADLKPSFENLFKDVTGVAAALKELMGEGLLFGEETGFAVKTVGGEPWLFAWSTNAFQDRENEIFSTKGLEDFAARAFEKEDKGSFDFWHIPGSEFARKEWIAVPGRYLAEAGPFLKDRKGARAYYMLTNHPWGHPDIAPEGWGCSPQFRYLPEEKEKGVFENFDITRTSVLPRFAAANIWTGEPEVMTMAISEQQEKAGRAFFGDELFDQIVEKGEAKTKEREEAGTAFKENETPEPETGEKQVAKFAAALRDVAKEVDDEAVKKQLQGAADGLSKGNMKERGGVVRAIAGKLKGDQKKRLQKIAAAMVEGGEYPEPSEEYPAPEEKEVAFPFDLEQVAGAVATQLKSLYEVDMAPLVEGLTATAAKLAAVEERLGEMEKAQEMKAETESPRWVLEMHQRATEAAETEVKEGEPLLEMKPRETPEQGGGKFVNAVFGAPK